MVCQVINLNVTACVTSHGKEKLYKTAEMSAKCEAVRLFDAIPINSWPLSCQAF